MPLYRVSVDISAPPDVVAERLRAVIGQPAGLWANSSDAPFVGAINGNSFQLRRNTQSRNSFLPQIRGRMMLVPTGTRVDVTMFMHPFVLMLMLVWLAYAGYGLRIASDAASAGFYVPLGMIVFGLTLSLGSFFAETMKAWTLLSSALFNSAINIAPQRPIVQPGGGIVLPPAQTSHRGLVPVGVVVTGVILLAVAFNQYGKHLRACPAFTDSLALVSESREARAALGESIHAGEFVRGVAHADAKVGYALLSIPIQGSRGKGTLYVVANRVRDRWNLERATLLTSADSRRLDLSPSTRPESFHYPARGGVYLIPLDNAVASYLSDLPGYYAARFGLSVTVLPVLSLGPETLDVAAKQVIAEKAIDFMTRANSKTAEDVDSIFLGVTSQDLNIKSAGYLSTNYRRGRFGIVSTAMLHGMPWFAGPNPEVFPVRVRKVVTKNVALLRYPVDLSADPTSALAGSAFTASDVDEMGEDFLGESGTWSPYPVSAPCFSITQGPHGAQSWRTDCSGDLPADSRFETFENDTDVTLFVMARADFPFASQRDLSFIREYRPHDNQSRSFGIGGNDSFDVFPVGDSQTFSYIELILEGGGRVHFNRVSRGTGYADAKMRAGVYMGSPFSRSRIEWNGNGWDLTTLGGWTYKFPSSGPGQSARQSALLRIDTGAGAVSIQRDSVGALRRAEAPDGSWINFTCDSKSRVILAQHSSGHTIRYEYDTDGNLMHVRDSENGEEAYKYDPANRLISVLDPAGRTLLQNTYGSLGEVTSQTLADHRKLRYEYGFDENQKTSEVIFTDDQGYVTRWLRGRDGFYATLPQPPKR